ncbi:MAG: thiamine-binding protein [Thiohalocapsa sp.]
MSVLLGLSIFPVDQGESLSAFVTPVVDLIASSGHAYQLTAMGTLVETPDIGQATALIAAAHGLLAELGRHRVYATAKLDSRDGPVGRLKAKTDSVERRLSGSRNRNAD